MSRLGVNGTLSPSDKKDSMNLVIKNEPSDQSLEQRGLIKSAVKVKDIIREHESYTLGETGIKHFNGSTLAYVTPVSMIANDVLM